jgi:hypothetical protein
VVVPRDVTQPSRQVEAQPRVSPAERLRAYRYKPGQSGNPLGPGTKLERFEAIADRLLRERHLSPPEFKLAPGKKLRREEIVMRKLVLAAEAGDVEATRILFDRKWPKPQRVEVTGANGGPIESLSAVATFILAPEAAARVREIARQALLGSGS